MWTCNLGNTWLKKGDGSWEQITWYTLRILDMTIRIVRILSLVVERRHDLFLGDMWRRSGDVWDPLPRCVFRDLRERTYSIITVRDKVPGMSGVWDCVWKETLRSVSSSPWQHERNTGKVHEVLGHWTPITWGSPNAPNLGKPFASRIRLKRGCIFQLEYGNEIM